MRAEYPHWGAAPDQTPRQLLPVPITKQEFYSAPSRKGLSAAEKAKRWADHQRNLKESKAERPALPHQVQSRVVAAGDNPFLMNLIDPEANPGQGVPDTFDVHTTKFQSITNVPVEFTASGEFAVVARPFLRGAIGHLRDGVSVGPVFNLGLWEFEGATSHYHSNRYLRAATTSLPVSSPSAGIGTVTVEYNVFGIGVAGAPRSGVDGGGHTPMLPATWPATGMFCPVDTADLIAGVHSLRIRVRFAQRSGTAATALTTYLKFMDASGVYTSSGTTHVNIYALNNQWVTLPVTAGTGVALGNVGFYATGGAGSGSFDVSSIELELVGAISLDDMVDFDDNTDALALANDFVALRPVGMSVLVTYRGPLINDGGYIAARTFAGVEGNPPVDYGSLTIIPGAYDGPLRQGAYAFWKPSELKDFDFYAPTHIGNESRGSLVVTGLATDPANAALRARIVTNWEAITYSRKYSPMPSVVAPDRIASAFAALSGQPTAFENPLHLAKIWKMAQRTVTKAADMAWRSRQAWMGPAARAIGAAVPELALPAQIAAAAALPF